MSQEGLAEPEYLQDPISLAVAEFDAKQRQLFSKTRQCAKLPTKRRLVAYFGAAQECEDSLVNTLRVIIEDPDASKQEKAEFMSTCLLGVDAKRVASFRAISPRGDFTEGPGNHEILAENIQRALDDNTPQEAILEELHSAYQHNFIADQTELMETMPGTRLFELKHAVLANAKDIGKIAAGACIGLLVAERITNSRD